MFEEIRWFLGSGHDSPFRDSSTFKEAQQIHRKTHSEGMIQRGLNSFSSFEMIMSFQLLWNN